MPVRRADSDLRANSVRTWGITPRAYFDRANELGLMVNAGVWFNPIRGSMSDSYEDAAYCARLKAEALAHVKDIKDHPALLFWNLGNEVFTFTESASEKKAFGLFLEDVIRAVHKEDPNHPVVYAAAGPEDLVNLKAYVPSLDVVGINTYGGYPWVLRWLEKENFDRPVVATEFGPFGEWDRMKDENHLPFDPSDHSKAKNYEDLWRAIEQSKDRAVGGYAFVLGEPRNQASLTWYNVNFNDQKREAYWTLYKLYSGKDPANKSPRIQHLKVDRVSGLAPGDKIQLEVKASDFDNDALTFDYFITDIIVDPLIVSPARLFPSEPKTLGPGKVQLRVPFDPGAYRVYAVAKDGHGNVAIANRSIKVEPLSR
jgi:hypothetical protein